MKHVQSTFHRLIVGFFISPETKHETSVTFPINIIVFL